MAIDFNFFDELPDNWETARVKNILDYNHHYPIGDGDHGSIKPEMYQDEGIPYLRVQNLSWGFDINYDNLVYISDEVNLANSKSILIPDDILIAKTGATVGKMAIIPKSMPQANTTSSVGKVTINQKLFNIKYFAYLFSSPMFQEQIKEKAYQKSAQPGFNIDDLIEFKIIIPPFNAQQQLANYLDQKTDKIDSTIAKNKELIQLLEEKRVALINQVVTKGLNPDVPMKDSGVEWIGEIPEHWAVNPLKSVANIIMGQSPNSNDINDENQGILFMQGNADFTDKYPNPSEYCTAPNKISREGDILMSVRAPVGELNISDKRYGIGRGLCSIQPINVTQSFLWYYLIKSKLDFNYYSNGSTFDAITIGNLSSFPITIPKLTEQKQIGNYLNKETFKIDKIIEKVTKNINLLEEYKTSLIHHVVTGKIDVRGEEI